MDKSSLLKLFKDTNSSSELKSSLANKKNVHAKGIVGSSLSFYAAQSFLASKNTHVLICNDKEEAAYYLNDVEAILDNKEVLFYPGSYRRPYQIEEVDNANILQRAEVLNKVNTTPLFLITYPDALFEKVVTKKSIEKNTLKISNGDTLSIDFVNEVLFEYEFKRVDFVTEPGEFSVRGGILDIFSFSHDEPYRIEFFGDEIDSIRTFDIASQLSNKTVTKISIIPNIEQKTQQEESRVTFFESIANESIIITTDLGMLYERIDSLFAKAIQTFEKLDNTVKRGAPKDLFCNGVTIKKHLSAFTHIQTANSFSEINGKPISGIAFQCKPQPSFNKQFELLIENLNENHAKGFTNIICCVSEQQAKRFHDIFEDMDKEVHYQTVVLSLYQGFIDHNLKLVCYTDHQIFERYHKFNLKNGFAKKQAITIKELTSLEIGDYVTHIDHGIGKFAGLQKIDVEGRKQEAIKLIYGERDILYLSIHALHKISKFNGKDGKAPTVHKLGSKAWKTLKQKTKARVKHIAYNLIKLYAKRKLEKGFQYAPDSYLQHELEASFLYEDTPDQSTATAAVKADMESEQPMDRLVCGDVGFGKTEVAIRAAFKAVDNGKQVAILVPTTVLAFQHFKTFSERLKDFPVTVDYLNRFRTAKQKRETLERLAEGKVDIIIGTHQLVGKKVQFKDLGLLVIDEEQKFGVAVKDKLKTIKANVDTLTLTATPIPRTLQFSLMAARDLSTITTAPPNRYPIDTQVIRFNEEAIRDAISYEIQRGGQVFFIHNRIQNIKEVAGMIQRLVPDAKVAVGHGQMEGKQLEELMLNFMDGAFDVLVSTTIIESGLDVPNANTIFINSANNFGISDLHQMRGRVGRSNKKAFCFCITPPYSAMTEDARKRITALVQFSELGSGIQIAMKDLEIRGAGDLLGGEQSGFINEIGFDTYQKILNEAIEELKQKEFKELYKEELENKVFLKDTQIDTDFSLLFPDDYINSISERLSLYTDLNKLKTEEELKQFEKELIDRFGALPSQAEDLLNSVRLKWIATKIGLEKIILKQDKMIGYFISDQQSEFYQSPIFTQVLQFVQQNPTEVVMKEKQTRSGLRFLLTFNNIEIVEDALSKMSVFNQ